MAAKLLFAVALLLIGERLEQYYPVRLDLIGSAAPLRETLHTPRTCQPSAAGVVAQAQNQTTFTNIPAALNGTGNFTVLLAAIDAAGLTSTLAGATLNVTIFAPTDAAFTAMLTALNVTAEEALAQPGLLTAVLNLHVLPTPVLAANIPTTPTTVRTL